MEIQSNIEHTKTNVVGLSLNQGYFYSYYFLDFFLSDHLMIETSRRRFLFPNKMTLMLGYFVVEAAAVDGVDWKNRDVGNASFHFENCNCYSAVNYVHNSYSVSC